MICCSVNPLSPFSDSQVKRLSLHFLVKNSFISIFCWNNINFLKKMSLKCSTKCQHNVQKPTHKTRKPLNHCASTYDANYRLPYPTPTFGGNSWRLWRTRYVKAGKQTPDTAAYRRIPASVLIGWLTVMAFPSRVCSPGSMSCFSCDAFSRHWWYRLFKSFKTEATTRQNHDLIVVS